MAKVSNKGRQRGTVSSAKPRSYSEMLRSEEKNKPSSVVAVKPTSDPAPAPHAKDKVNLKEEYSKVILDVRQLLGISAILFVVMIVLGFVI